MITKKINKVSKNKRILLVPLDWGLGHATRCIPLIKEFQANGCEVIIAAEKATYSLLKHEFQQLTFITLKGYRISYSANSNKLLFKVLTQVPHLLIQIYNEHRWIKKVVKNYAIDAIISDNRFGLFHSTLPCVYITHQLLIKTGIAFTEKFGQVIHGWVIKKYSACWVPDFEEMHNISGELSHSSPLPANINYIGGLSRFEFKKNITKKYDLLILISGPEPQRTIFEDLLLYQVQNFNGEVLLVRGLPELEKDTLFPKGKNLHISNHLSAEALNEAIQQSALVISRSGYTTIMDLIKLKQKAILVPTPGQTEQEYLAAHLMSQGFFYTTTQDEFELTKVLKHTAIFPFAFPAFDMELYKKKVVDFVQTL